MEKIYAVIFDWSTDDDKGRHLEVFSTFEKALKRFNEFIEEEKDPDKSPFSDAFDKNGNFIDNGEYELSICDCRDTDTRFPMSWEISKCGDWYFHDYLSIEVLEVA